jgi:hypothetical protein
MTTLANRDAPFRSTAFCPVDPSLVYWYEASVPDPIASHRNHQAPWLEWGTLVPSTATSINTWNRIDPSHFGVVFQTLAGVEGRVATGQKRCFTDGPPVWRTAAGGRDRHAPFGRSNRRAQQREPDCCRRVGPNRPKFKPVAPSPLAPPIWPGPSRFGAGVMMALGRAAIGPRPGLQLIGAWAHPLT